MPNRQAVARQRSIDTGLGRYRQQGRYGISRQHANQQAKEDQHLDRHLHVAWRLMRRVFGQVDRLTIEKHVVDETQ